jgi:hypothetical protein
MTSELEADESLIGVEEDELNDETFGSLEPGKIECHLCIVHPFFFSVLFP